MWLAWELTAELPLAEAGLLKMSQLHTKHEVLKQPLQRFS